MERWGWRGRYVFPGGGYVDLEIKCDRIVRSALSYIGAFFLVTAIFALFVMTSKGVSGDLLDMWPSALSLASCLFSFHTVTRSLEGLKRL